ncbi:DUF1129 domain-containing protein [Aerococcus suis]|uniref:Uncharacterized membrane-anchored protein n=1 Tax=Aerococcus suis TaxID=371602 RepID=A0A1W1ZE70_9LACT|nr:DUF1129 family protein [Aerococcus suis]MCI7240124.1 DUF1129 domain-containing protein [Aerococcus suis]MDD7758490.1 DUF1129 family protein [Aerococcus suis]MDY4647323.1 DUF1129 family protein [Aerococcus suis]SMC46461.1 Uncharacterized membrane-anchored protein [Aerococcus suis]
MAKKQHEQVDMTASRANWERENAELYPQLTNKNNAFMHQLNKEMAHRDFDGEWLEKENEMLHELVAHQTSGVTAKHLYGTPRGYADKLENGDYDNATPQESAPFWQYVVEGGLLIGGVFALINGIIMLFGNGTEGAQSAGVITMLLNFVIGGFAMAVITKNQPDVNQPKGERGMGRYLLSAVGVMVLWIFFISMTQLLPPAINPVMPPFIYIALGVIALAGRWWFKKAHGITGTLF